MALVCARRAWSPEKPRDRLRRQSIGSRTAQEYRDPNPRRPWVLQEHCHPEVLPSYRTGRGSRRLRPTATRPGPAPHENRLRSDTPSPPWGSRLSSVSRPAGQQSGEGMPVFTRSDPARPGCGSAGSPGLAVPAGIRCNFTLQRGIPAPSGFPTVPQLNLVSPVTVPGHCFPCPSQSLAPGRC